MVGRCLQRCLIVINFFSQVALMLIYNWVSYFQDKTALATKFEMLITREFGKIAEMNSDVVFVVEIDDTDVVMNNHCIQLSAIHLRRSDDENMRKSRIGVNQRIHCCRPCMQRSVSLSIYINYWQIVTITLVNKNSLIRRINRTRGLNVRLSYASAFAANRKSSRDKPIASNDLVARSRAGQKSNVSLASARQARPDACRYAALWTARCSNTRNRRTNRPTDNAPTARAATFFVDSAIDPRVYSPQFNAVLSPPPTAASASWVVEPSDFINNFIIVKVAGTSSSRCNKLTTIDRPRSRSARNGVGRTIKCGEFSTQFLTVLNSQ